MDLPIAYARLIVPAGTGATALTVEPPLRIEGVRTLILGEAAGPFASYAIEPPDLPDLLPLSVIPLATPLREAWPQGTSVRVSGTTDLAVEAAPPLGPDDAPRRSDDFAVTTFFVHQGTEYAVATSREHQIYHVDVFTGGRAVGIHLNAICLPSPHLNPEAEAILLRGLAELAMRCLTG
jgi:hypothetical protein